MRFDGRFQDLTTGSAVVLWVLVTGCDTALDIDTSSVAPAAASDTDPIDVLGAGDQYNPPPLLNAVAIVTWMKGMIRLIGLETPISHEDRHVNAFLEATDTVYPELAEAIAQNDIGPRIGGLVKYSGFHRLA